LLSNDTATTQSYTLSLHDALPIYKFRNYSATETIKRWPSVRRGEEKHIFPYQEEADVMFNTALLYELAVLKPYAEPILLEVQPKDRKSTRLNSSHVKISYAVFCLK